MGQAKHKRGSATTVSDSVDTDAQLAASPEVTQDDVYTYMSQEHTARLFMMSSRITNIAMQHNQKKLESQLDEANLRTKQEALSLAQAEFALRNAQRQAEADALAKTQERMLAEYFEFRGSLGRIYGVDFETVAVDDETGRIVVLPTTTS